MLRSSLHMRLDVMSELQCRRERVCSVHSLTQANISGGAHVFGTFLSLTRVASAWPLRWTRGHWKEMSLNWWVEIAVESVMCLVCACWLDNCGLSFKSRRHVNLNRTWYTVLQAVGKCFAKDFVWSLMERSWLPITKATSANQNIIIYIMQREKKEEKEKKRKKKCRRRVAATVPNVTSSSTTTKQMTGVGFRTKPSK